MQKDIQLTYGVIILRPYQISDINYLYEAARESIAEVSVWLPWCHANYSIEESRTWVKERPEK